MKLIERVRAVLPPGVEMTQRHLAYLVEVAEQTIGRLTREGVLVKVGVEPPDPRMPKHAQKVRQPIVRLR